MELSNEQLQVEIAEIGWYSGSRFDWTGFIKQVALKKEGYTFCVLEKEAPLSVLEGSGICNEFGIFEALGYEETPVGSHFPKLGIGLLTREDERGYSFSKAYPIVSYPFEVAHKGNYIEFVVQPIDCRGFAVKLIKRISLIGASLHIDYMLHNVGLHPIHTNEYTHNFIGINGHRVGPEYVLKFSFPLALEKSFTPNQLRVIGQEIRWNRKPVDEFYSRFTGFSENSIIQWELVHEPSGVGMRETAHFPASMIAVWGAAHVVSPEIFIDIQLKPGETKTWKRTYDFFCK